jgi:hypothetical protein
MITRASLHVFASAEPAAAAPNRGGRPKVAEPRIPVSSRVTAAEYDRIAAAARARGVSVAAFVRAACRSAIRPPR